MNNNDPHQRLDNLFARARQQQPLFEKEKVHSLIKNAPTKAFPGKQLVNYLKSNVKLIAMSTILSVFISVVMFVFYNKSIEPQINIGSQIHAGEKNRKEFAASPILEQKKPVLKHIGSKPKYPILVGDTMLLELSQAELEKLGFRFDSLGIQYSNVSPSKVLSGLNIKNGSINPDYWMAETDKHSTRFDFYPVKVTNRFVEGSVFDCSMISKSVKNTVSLSDLDRDRLGKKIRDMNLQMFTAPRKNIVMTVSPYVDNDLFQEKFEIENDTLIPLLIKKQMVSNLLKEDMIIWMKTSYLFFNHLPIRYQKSVRYFNNAMKKQSTLHSNSNLVKYETFSHFFNTLSLKKISLTIPQLRKIGFTFKDSSFAYTYTIGDSTLIRWVMGDYFCGVGYDKDTILPKRPGRDFYPIDISDSKGSRPIIFERNKTTSESQSLFVERVNYLVPIYISKNSYKKDLPAADLIFWFTPTEAFFDSLPPHIGREMREEYHALLSKNDPAISQEQKAKISTGCVYFEECQSTYSDVQNLEVYPNPVLEVVNIDVNLKKAGTVYINLYDINGRVLKSLKDPTPVSEGFHRFSFSLADVRSGIYVIAIHNINGQYKSQRIIKQ